MHLVLIGTAHVPIPKHPRIHHVGFVEDQDKYDAMAAAEVLIMPSYLESLSMVALEAWAMGKPVLANAKCDVLQGQCVRSNAGLFYANYPEFAETLRAIDTTPSLQTALGRNGRTFFERHYAWPVIIKKYVDMLNQLARETSSRQMEPLPGWFTRRRRNLPAADAIVKALPSGPYRERQPRPSPPSPPPHRQTVSTPPPRRPQPAERQAPRQEFQRRERPDGERDRERRPEPQKTETREARPDRGRDQRRGGRQHRRRRPGGGGGAR
jgi:hypothetical protein